MNIFGCALQCCYIKFMLKVTKIDKKKPIIKADN